MNNLIELANHCNYCYYGEEEIRMDLLNIDYHIWVNKPFSNFVKISYQVFVNRICLNFLVFAYFRKVQIFSHATKHILNENAYFSMNDKPKLSLMILCKENIHPF